MSANSKLLRTNNNKPTNSLNSIADDFYNCIEPKVGDAAIITSNQLGDVITSSNTTNGGVFTRTITGLDLPSNVDDVSNLKLIAFVRNTYTKTFVDYFGETHSNSPHYDIYNVQEVHLGESQAFD